MIWKKCCYFCIVSVTDLYVYVKKWIYLWNPQKRIGWEFLGFVVASRKE